MINRLAHPVILRGFDATLDGPRPHLVLEHLEGPRLSSLVRRYGPLPPEQLIPLGVQLASAVHYLSREGIVHLDIKPSNTIMGAPPRMIDMSVALSVEEAAAVRTQVGTDAYMAPEQADPEGLGPVRDGRGRVGPGSDALQGGDRASFPTRSRAMTTMLPRKSAGRSWWRRRCPWRRGCRTRWPM